MDTAKRLGSSYVLDTNDSNNKFLKIYLNDLKNAADGGDIQSDNPNIGLESGVIAAITTNNIDSYIDKIIGALVVLMKTNQNATDTVDSIGLYVQEPTVSTATREGVTRLVYDYRLRFYASELNSDSIDPSDIYSA